MKKIIYITLFSLSSLCVHAGIIPIAARYDGAGGAYGVGYETKYKDYKIILGGVTGDATAIGGLVTKVFSKDLELSVGALSFSDISLLTTYNRNFTDDENEQYILNIKGQAVAIGSKLWLFSDTITLNASATKSTIQFENYQDSSEEEIDLAGANLFDIETTAIKLGIDYNFFDNQRAPTRGVGVNTSLTSISGRTGQSDQAILDYKITGIMPLFNHFSILASAKFSDALVNVDKKYDSDQEVRDALGADCSSIADISKRTKCQKLEDALVAYILENNLKGTTTPLGGSGGLRSFREQRFKAAHTALYTAEFRTNLSSLFNLGGAKGARIDFVLFYDQAFSNDDKLKLLDESKFSNGASLQFTKNQGSVKLQAASGSDNSSSWSLSFGKSF